MVNVGIIGCGSITRFRHAPEYSSNQNVNISGFYDPRADRSNEMTEIYGGKIFGSYEEMLADKSIDAISVCSLNVYHAPCL